MNCMKWSGVLLIVLAGVTLGGAGCGKRKDGKDAKDGHRPPVHQTGLERER